MIRRLHIFSCLFTSKQIAILAILVCSFSISQAQVDVTFRVNMIYQEVDPTGVFLETSQNWGTPIQLSNTENSVYSVTIPVNTLAPIQYKFKNGATFEGNAQPACGLGANRAFTSTGADTTLPLVCYDGSCVDCPTETNVTFRVNLALEPVSADPVYLVTSADWNTPVEMLLTTGYLYQATVSVPVNSEVEYYFVHGTEQENAAQSGCNSGDNRIVTTGVANQTLPIVCFGGFCGNCSTNADVTFRVNMRNEVISPDGVFIETSAAWGTPFQLTQEPGGDVYSAIVPIPNNQSIQYKFKNGTTFEGNAQAGCGAGVNRFFTSGVTSQVRPIVCFGGLCTDCTEPIDYTFQVDVNREEFNSSDIIYISGSFNDWCESCEPLTNLGNGIWEATHSLVQNSAYEYRYSRGSSGTIEPLSAVDSCVFEGTQGISRSLTTITGDSTLASVCFGFCTSCDDFPPQAYVTFILEMSDYVGDISNGIFISSDWNSWCTTCDELVEISNNRYETTLRLDSGLYQFKYVLADNSDIEAFESNDECAMAFDAAYSRYVNILNSDSITIGPFFWNTCDSISTVGLVSIMSKDFIVYPNPTSNLLFIQNTSNKEVQIIEIFNQLGQKIKQLDSSKSQSNSIDISELSRGVYFIQITHQKGITTQKIIRR